jgi:hypothetical protein
VAVFRSSETTIARESIPSGCPVITIAFQELVRLFCTTALLDCGEACGVEDVNDWPPHRQQQQQRRGTTTTKKGMDDFDDNPSTGGGSNDFDANARVRKWAGQIAQSAAHTVQELTSRKYALPDKNVASQLLMYRQVRTWELYVPYAFGRWGAGWVLNISNKFCLVLIPAPAHQVPTRPQAVSGLPRDAGAAGRQAHAVVGAGVRNDRKDGHLVR